VLRSSRATPPSAYVSLVLALFGLGDSTYLTVEHYTGSTTLACSDTGAVNCLKVTTSQWSHIGPIPVAVFGLAFFVGMSVLCLPWAWQVRELDPLRTLGAVVGVLSAIYLVWVELFQVDAICVWCTAVHVATLFLLAAVLWTSSEIRTA
jgi:uncharacterized membrane protein